MDHHWETMEIVRDLFADLGRLRIRKMFGCTGVYANEEMFALVDADRIYLKTDEALRVSLEAEGGTAFHWTNGKTGQTIRMSYVSVPEATLGNHARTTDLGRKALAAARQARQSRVKTNPRGRLGPS